MHCKNKGIYEDISKDFNSKEKYEAIFEDISSVGYRMAYHGNFSFKDLKENYYSNIKLLKETPFSHESSPDLLSNVNERDIWSRIGGNIRNMIDEKISREKN